jgi:hypothetical protein
VPHSAAGTVLASDRGQADEGFHEGGQSSHARQAWGTSMSEPGETRLAAAGRHPGEDAR